MLVSLILCGMARDFETYSESVRRWVARQADCTVQVIVCVWDVRGTYTTAVKDYSRGEGYVDHTLLDVATLRAHYPDAVIKVLSHAEFKPTFAADVQAWRAAGVVDTSRAGTKGDTYHQGAFFSQFFNVQEAMACVRPDADVIVRVRPDRDLDTLPDVATMQPAFAQGAVVASRYDQRPDVITDQWLAGSAPTVRAVLATAYDRLKDAALMQRLLQAAPTHDAFSIEAVITAMVVLFGKARMWHENGPSVYGNKYPALPAGMLEKVLEGWNL